MCQLKNNKFMICISGLPGERGDYGDKGPAGLTAERFHTNFSGVVGDWGDVGDRGPAGNKGVEGKEISFHFNSHHETMIERGK